MYRKKVVMPTVTTAIMSLIFTCMNFWVGEFWGILRRGSVCAPTACEVVHD
jgi:hypothetical protein